MLFGFQWYIIMVYKTTDPENFTHRITHFGASKHLSLLLLIADNGTANEPQGFHPEPLKNLWFGL